MSYTPLLFAVLSTQKCQRHPHLWVGENRFLTRKASHPRAVQMGTGYTVDVGVPPAPPWDARWGGCGITQSSHPWAPRHLQRGTQPRCTEDY